MIKAWISLGLSMFLGSAWAQKPLGGKVCLELSTGRQTCLHWSVSSTRRVLRDTLNESPSLEAVFSNEPQFISSVTITEEYDTGVSSLVTATAACEISNANDSDPHTYPLTCRLGPSRDGIPLLWIRGSLREDIQTHDSGSSTRLEKSFKTTLTLQRLELHLDEVRLWGETLDTPVGYTLFPPLRP